MSGTVTAASACRTVLAARTSPDAAVLVVALRGGHWPYSCGLASTVRHLSPRLSVAGAEVLLLAGETPQAREAIAAAWRLPFRWLPEAAVEPVARELGAWDEASGRILDGLGLLGPDGDWILRQDFDDPGGTGSPEAALAALAALTAQRDTGPAPVLVPEPTLGGGAVSEPGVPSPSRTAGAGAFASAPASGGAAGSPSAGLPFSAGAGGQRSAGPELGLSAGPATEPSTERAGPAGDCSAAVPHRVAVCDPAHVAGVLRRALAAADRLTKSLPPSSPAAARAGRTRLRLALYLHAVQDLVPAHGPT